MIETETSYSKLSELKKNISIIGEPLIRERIGFLLSEKLGEKSKDEIIAELQKENQELKKNR
jgi:hypothetical protein